MEFDRCHQLLDLHDTTKDDAYLERAITIHGSIIKNPPEDRLSHAYLMARLAGKHLKRFQVLENLHDIDRAVDLMDQVLNMTPLDHDSRSRRLIELGLCYGNRFERTAQVADLDTAISAYQQADELVSSRDKDQSLILAQIARWLTERHLATNSAQDLDLAVDTAKAALLLAPDNTNILTTLANALTYRFERRSDHNDLDQSLSVFEKAVRLSSAEPEREPGILQAYAHALRERFELFGNIRDLDLAIATISETMDLVSQGSPLKYTYMQDQATYLGRRFIHTGGGNESNPTQDLDDALLLTEKILLEAPPAHRDRPDWLEAHGNKLGMRFEVLGDGKSLDEAIKYTQEAVASVSRSSYSYPYKLINYGNWLGERFQRTLSIEDLNKAIEVTDEAVNVTLESDRNKARWRSRLGKWLRRRAESSGDQRDLDHAIEVLELAVESTPQEDVDRPPRLLNLATCYAMRFDQNRRLEDLNKSIDTKQMALDQTPADNPFRATLTGSLGNDLYRRAKHSRSKADMDDSIQKYEEGLGLAHPHSMGRLCDLTFLGKTLRERFELFSEGRSTEDIDRSIKVLKEALDVVENDNSWRCRILWNIGLSYVTLYNETDEPPDDALENALLAFKECFQSPHCEAWYRISGARNAAVVLMDMENPKEAAGVLKEAIRLLPTLTPRFLSRLDQQRAIAQLSGVASLATWIALEAELDLYECLVLLEGSRGIMASLLMETRMDMSMMDQETASEFREARERLAAQASSSGKTGLATDDLAMQSLYVRESQSRYVAEEELQLLIKRIQADPRSKDFLQPPSLDELLGILDNDTIVVLSASKQRSAAFVINKRNAISLVELTNLDLDDINKHVHRLQSSRPYVDIGMLEWLWDVIACPILDRCGFGKLAPGQSLPRVFWIPTGSLSRLPIHAAGRHSIKSKDSVMDRVMSSYSSSLRSLVYAKKVNSKAPNVSNHGSMGKALLVAMGKAPKDSRLSSLPFATKEVEKISNLCPSLGLDPVRLSSQTRAGVLEELGSLFFHFAGHGYSDSLDPAQSGLHLEDGLLTVADIQAHKMGEQAPFLGYLSACLTGANDADRLIDEGIHLISACQLAGFRHVIGAMWQVSDNSCAQVAESAYSGIASRGMTDRSVCAALHDAVLALRDAWVATRPSATRSMADPSVTQYYDRIDDEEEEEEDDSQRDDGGRDGRLKSTNVRVAALVTADWVPYVHYGP
ncbi:tpr domain protein [Fusarium sp. NRRL 52700]|nr:tpr domain protein [Fusarium sp. NRRL 52700]